MTKTLLTIALISLASTLLAQQDPLYSHYLLNPLVLNPAYAGFNKQFTAMAGFRKQWAGFDGSPTSFYGTGHSSFLNNSVGVGLIFNEDKVGAESTTGFQAVYAYHIRLRKDKRFSFGLQGGMINYATDFGDLTIDQADPRFQQNVNIIKPTVGVGALYASTKLFVGLSVPRLLKASTSINDDPFTYYNRHAYFMLAYVTSVSYNVKVKPFLVNRLVKNSTLSTDIGLCISANNAYTVGLFTRNMHTYGLLASVDLGDKLRFGYVFELPGNKSTGTNFTSHEVTITTRLKWFRSHDVLGVNDF